MTIGYPRINWELNNIPSMKDVRCKYIIITAIRKYFPPTNTSHQDAILVFCPRLGIIVAEEDLTSGLYWTHSMLQHTHRVTMRWVPRNKNPGPRIYCLFASQNYNNWYREILFISNKILYILNIFPLNTRTTLIYSPRSGSWWDLHRSIKQGESNLDSLNDKSESTSVNRLSFWISNSKCLNSGVLIFDIFCFVLIILSAFFAIFELRLKYSSAVNFLECLLILQRTRHSITRVMKQTNRTRTKNPVPSSIAISIEDNSSMKFLILENKIW